MCICVITNLLKLVLHLGDITIFSKDAVHGCLRDAVDAPWSLYFSLYPNFVLSTSPFRWI